MMRRFLTRQFVYFLLVGSFAALVNFGSRFIYSSWVSFPWAVFFAYLTGMTTAFILADLFVFKKTNKNIYRAILFFCLVNCIALIQTWGITMVLAYYVFPHIGLLKNAKELAHALGICAPVFTSYLGHKYFTFR